MADHPPTLIEKAQAQLWAWLLPALGATISAGLLWAQTYFAQYLQDPTGILSVRLLAAAILLLSLGVSAFFYFRPKFRHLTRLGVHQDIKTGAYFCSPCLINKKLHSPLRELPDGSRWHCRSCGVSANNPDHVKPPTPPREKHSWMSI